MTRKFDRLTESDWKRARWLHDQGYSATAIGKRFGISHQAAAKGLREGKGL